MEFFDDIDDADLPQVDHAVTVKCPSEWGQPPRSFNTRVRLYTEIADFNQMPESLQGIFNHRGDALFETVHLEGTTIWFDDRQGYIINMTDEIGDKFSAARVRVVDIG